MSEWQPIETAPKDDTLVLLCCRNGTITIGPTKTIDVPKDVERIHRRELYEQHGVWPNAEWNVTHWMPLPPPPTTPEGK